MADDSVRASVVHVLHIGEDAPRGGPTDNVNSAVDSPSFVVQSCTDVYRGLARVCGGRDPALGAIVVCVDGLTDGELEFFSITARVTSGLPVLVYGADRYADRVQAALHAGATGVATAEAIQALIPQGRDGFPEADAAGDAGALPRVTCQDRGDGMPTVEQGDLELSELSSGGGDDTPRPIRVPWEQYNQASARRAPAESSSSHDPSITASPPPTGRKPTPRGPLLTSEELQALIGDDIAAIAPEEPEGIDPRAPLDDGNFA